MKNWLRHTKKACILAFCAAVIPAGYQNLRTLAGWPRPQAAEGIIPDSLIVKKQSFEMAVEQKAALSRRSSFSQWNSFPDSAENGRPGTVIDSQTPPGNNDGQNSQTPPGNNGTQSSQTPPGNSAGEGSQNSSGSTAAQSSQAFAGGSTAAQNGQASAEGSAAAQSGQAAAGNAGEAGSQASKTRVIRSAGTGGNKTGPGGESYPPVMTVAAPITGYLGGSKLTLLANQTASQMLSVLIETNQGKIIMIDGGVEEDAAHLIQSLMARGGHVDTWLITHPHSDHVGALNYILSHPECGITVDNLYYSFANLSWYQEYEAYRADMVAALMNTLSLLPQEKLHGDIYKGQEIWVDNIKITVMNKPYLQSYNSINNSSVAYMLDINGKKALFLGDMGAETGKQFIEDTPPELLTCDILQMAHHGQNGVGLEVYQVLRPEICLWPAPEWLWNNDSGSGVNSGSWRTIETRSWMAQLGVPYHVCIKDGDQTIQ